MLACLRAGSTSNSVSFVCLGPRGGGGGAGGCLQLVLLPLPSFTILLLPLTSFNFLLMSFGFLYLSLACFSFLQLPLSFSFLFLLLCSNPLCPRPSNQPMSIVLQAPFWQRFAGGTCQAGFEDGAAADLEALRPRLVIREVP